MAPLRIAIVGCGKVSERFHLPVASASDRVEVSALVDPDLARARSLATAFSVPRAFSDPAEVAGEADAVIIAAPHHVHASVAVALMEQGLHVLVEKPMALDTGECDRMIEASERTGRVLAIGLVRRFYHASRLVKEVLDTGVLGRVDRFDFREGAVFNWAVASDATFRRDAGGGVLSDTGPHVLDTLLWWLGDHDHVSYFDDAMGGVEADCELHLRMRSGASGVVELSRTRTLRNTARIEAEHGSLEIGPGFDPEVVMRLHGTEHGLAGRPQVRGPRPSSLEEIFDAQLDDFVDAIVEERPPFVPGSEGRRAIALIEACRAARRPLELPWLNPDEEKKVKRS